MDEAAALAVQVAGRECDPAFLTACINRRKEILSSLSRACAHHARIGADQTRGRASSRRSASKRSAPPRIQAVIAARFAQLSPPAYELAGLAASIGRPFSFDLLAKATDWDEDSLSRALEELWQRRIIDGQGAGAYDFTHDLLREVAYSELSPIRRRSLHRRVAVALEELLCRRYRGSERMAGCTLRGGGYAGTGHPLLPGPRLRGESNDSPMRKRPT